jgi:hypothetical protein
LTTDNLLADAMLRLAERANAGGLGIKDCAKIPMLPNPSLLTTALRPPLSNVSHELLPSCGAIPRPSLTAEDVASRASAALEITLDSLRGAYSAPAAGNAFVSMDRPGLRHFGRFFLPIVFGQCVRAFGPTLGPARHVEPRILAAFPFGRESRSAASAGEPAPPIISCF